MASRRPSFLFYLAHVVTRQSQMRFIQFPSHIQETLMSAEILKHVEQNSHVHATFKKIRKEWDFQSTCYSLSFDFVICFQFRLLHCSTQLSESGQKVRKMIKKTHGFPGSDGVAWDMWMSYMWVVVRPMTAVPGREAVPSLTVRQYTALSLSCYCVHQRHGHAKGMLFASMFTKRAMKFSTTLAILMFIRQS